jgi:type IV pilus assembly protein PilE
MRNDLSHPRRRRLRARAGVTLLEMGIAVTIAGILLALTVPSFARVTEQNRVDAAAQYLRSVWCAQRVYWLENRTFATTLGALDGLNLIDPKVAAGSDGYFTYAITAADEQTFAVTATRAGSAVWSGTLSINQDGEVTGHVDGSGGTVLTPPDI